MTTDDEMSSFKIADQKIRNPLKQLDDKNICPCCTAKALAFHGAFMAEATMGSNEAIEMLEDLIGHLREITAPDPMPLTKVH